MAGESRPGAPRRSLTAAEALALLSTIDRALDAVCETAPMTVAAFGGRPAVVACCQMTCVGPVPRLPEHAWEAMAYEHADRQWQRQGLRATRR